MPPDSMGSYIRECMHPHAASEHTLVHHHSFRHVISFHELPQLPTKNNTDFVTSAPSLTEHLSPVPQPTYVANQKPSESWERERRESPDHENAKPLTVGTVELQGNP